MYSNARFVKNKKKTKDLLELPAALYLALSVAVGHRRCIFQSEPVRTHSHSRLVNRRQLQIFSMPNISRASATHRRFPQIASLIIHTARLSLAGTSTDLSPISGICRRFIKTCRRVKNRAKIVQCELGIREFNRKFQLVNLTAYINVHCISGFYITYCKCSIYYHYYIRLILYTIHAD